MDKLTRRLRKNRRQSAQAIPVYAGMLIILAMSFWLVGRFLVVPVWLTVVFLIALGVTALTLVGDIINVVYSGWRLRGRG